MLNSGSMRILHKCGCRDDAGISTPILTFPIEGEGTLLPRRKRYALDAITGLSPCDALYLEERRFFDICLVCTRRQPIGIYEPRSSMPGGVVVAQRTLDPLTEVRILAGQLPTPVRWISARLDVHAYQLAVVSGTREIQECGGLGEVAGAAGFEPATLGFGDRCSTKLSYAPAPNNYNFSGSTSCGQTFNTCRQSLLVVALYEVKVQNLWMKATQRTVSDFRFLASLEVTWWMNAPTRRTCTYRRACSAERKAAPVVACLDEKSPCSGWRVR